ncbi:hypothetical protein D3C84_211180 [compost metagenome]
MSPSRSKRGLSVYLSARQLLPGSGTTLQAWTFCEDTAEAGLRDWLAAHGHMLKNPTVEVELAGDLAFCFCLPFSPAMDSPANVRRIAEGYLQNALGRHSPTQLVVAEPLRHGAPVVVVGVQTAAGFTDMAGAASKRVRSIQSYSLATWNRYAQQLPSMPCWLAVIEPQMLTLIYSQSHGIFEVVNSRAPRTDQDLGRAILDVVRRQFHRPSVGVFCVDEFDLLGDESPGIELLARHPGGFGPLAQGAEE